MIGLHSLGFRLDLKPAPAPQRGQPSAEARRRIEAAREALARQAEQSAEVLRRAGFVA